MASAKAGALGGNSPIPTGSKSSAPSPVRSSSDRKEWPKPQTPVGGQPRTAKAKGLQEARAKGMESEFAVKHMGLLAVLAWVL